MADIFKITIYYSLRFLYIHYVLKAENFSHVKCAIKTQRNSFSSPTFFKRYFLLKVQAVALRRVFDITQNRMRTAFSVASTAHTTDRRLKLRITN
jgi:hypothetical protein